MERLELKEAIKLIKEEYKDNAEHAKELSRILETKSVRRYIEIMGYEYPKITFEEDIMNNILKKYSIESDNRILLDTGLYLISDEDSYYEERRLIKESDISYIEKEKKDNPQDYVGTFITHICYDLIDGSNFYCSPDNLIILPSLQEFINTLDDYPSKNYKFSEYNYNNKYNIARSQFYIMLMKENIKYVLEYYSNIKNAKEIENKIDKYIKKKELKLNKNEL